MKIQCFIVDDDHSSVEILKKYVERTPFLSLSGTFLDPLEALQEINRNGAPCDVAFLDMEMKGLSGLELAGRIKGKLRIIFVSSNPDYAFCAIEADAVDFILKPVTYERFLKAVDKLGTHLSWSNSEANHTQKMFFINEVVKKKIVRIRFDEVDYVESCLNYIKIFAGKQESMMYLSLKEMESFLPESQFMRVHKSYVINTDKIVSVDGNMVRLENNFVIAVGEGYRKGFFDKLHQKLLRKKI